MRYSCFASWRFFLVGRNIFFEMRLYENTTIAAIATPPGYGGIGVIRLSGDDSLKCLQSLLDTKKATELVPNQVSLQSLIHSESGQVIDEALITYFRSPHSYTGEDVVEISCHGSPVVLTEILRLLASSGAELAKPGEFTLRAFLNQRIDLSQAEAVNDLIHSQTRYQAQLATRQLRGEVSKQLKPLKNALVEMIVYFESSLEFVEDDLDSLNIERFQLQIDILCSSVQKLISSYQLGRLVKSGIKLAIVGQPNVGKSSIFNALLGRDRAIVSAIPGTTRDTLSEVLAIKGIPVELIDTAGIRETQDVIENLGVERTQSAIADADLVIAVIEASHNPTTLELTFLSLLPFDLLVINKCDLEMAFDEEFINAIKQNKPVAEVSALTNQGIGELQDLIHSTLSSGSLPIQEGGIITNERHYQALLSTSESLLKAKQDLDLGFSEEIILVHLHEALRCLGIITGETLIGDIINQIFATFCIGK
ncbi:MAG: tRNA uridine-5-carboxymethylaminomethyl(34) synthesis GTPase MnmE [Acidobacteria bacterium]|nr:tRNA uridine-5-carboxymethylaminomethyl(34) synthesis GTPase MnmE [Acidobacteriota bacterium]